VAALQRLGDGIVYGAAAGRSASPNRSAAAHASAAGNGQDSLTATTTLYLSLIG
jgi:hypothetical protein